MRHKINIFWFRRDLRLDDNAGLHMALKRGLPVLPVFVFDTDILDRLPDRADRRVTYIYKNLERMDARLRQAGSSLCLLHGTPEAAFGRLLDEYAVDCVFANGDYEPAARTRDAAIEALCRVRGVSFRLAKDQVVFEKDEVVKADGSPYTVFTPYSRRWKRLFAEQGVPDYGDADPGCFVKHTFPFPSLGSIGFKHNDSHLDEPRLDEKLLAGYHAHRDIPYPGMTTRASLALRFGTVSVRRLAALAARVSEKYLNELIWREFFMQVLWHFPHVEDRPFNKRYENIQWMHDEEAFARWRAGETGFPLVDAGMRELEETGFMHNRVRMVVANFLTRLLLIDWQWGEAWFAEKLADFELSSNNGNWQWAAGCGCDAAPYFRIFNPGAQQQRFDPDFCYVRQWIPGFDPARYRKPIVDYASARQRALNHYKRALA